VKDDRIYIDHILECWEIIERDLPAFRAAIEAMRTKTEKL